MQDGIRTRRNARGEPVYQLIVYAGVDDAGNKRYLRRTLSPGTSLRDAKRARTMLAADVMQRAEPASAARTVNELHEEWWRIVSPGFSPDTRTGYERVWKLRVKPALGELRVDDLSPRLLEDLYTRLATTGGRGGRPLAPSTVLKVHILLSSMLTAAVRWGWVPPPHAAARARHPSLETATPTRAPEPELVARLLGAAEERDPELALSAVWRR